MEEAREVFQRERAEAKEKEEERNQTGGQRTVEEEMQEVWNGMKRERVEVREDWLKPEEAEAKKCRIIKKIQSMETIGDGGYEVQTVAKYRVTKRGLVMIDHQVKNKRVEEPEPEGSMGLTADLDDDQSAAYS